MSPRGRPAAHDQALSRRLEVEEIRQVWANAPGLSARVIALEGAVIFQFIGTRSVAEAQRIVHYLRRVETDIPRLLLAASMKAPPPAKAPTAIRFPNRLKELREAAEWTQLQLAARVGTTGQMISYYEAGKAEPRMATLLQLARAFNVSIDQLVGFAPERER
jgi:DNA-binding XRE family transcriptional regulator